MQDVILFLKNMKKMTKYYENDIENHVTYSFNLNDKKKETETGFLRSSFASN